MWTSFCRHPLGKWALALVILYVLVGVYAPLLSSSKPLIVLYDGTWFFPLFRYLFFRGFFTKLLDIFFNLLMFTLPLIVLGMWWKKRWLWSGALILQGAFFTLIALKTPHDPAASPQLNQERNQAIEKKQKMGLYFPSWSFDLNFMTPYARLNLVLREIARADTHQRLESYVKEGEPIPSLWQLDHDNEQRQMATFKKALAAGENPRAQAQMQYLVDRRQWLNAQVKMVSMRVMPLLTPYHWEDDAGGGQSINKQLPLWEVTRITRKNLLAALLFGIRISLVVGILAVSLALAIGIPVGALAGYYGGKFDIIVSRLLEIWESMPTLFMLLLVVAIIQSKSIFLVIAVIGIFGWTSFSRYIRGEFFKQRQLPYVEACYAQGFHDRYIIFRHILPNAIPPLLTLLPFAVMGAITSESALSFLGLGEEGSCSWGVLMDEGRSAFPGESYLLWPPAILLTVLLIAIALVGDALRDAIDPKMR